VHTRPRSIPRLQVGYRSAGCLSPDPTPLYFNRPFVLLIAKGDQIEFGLKVTDDATFDVAAAP
jgi:hypothetical protein